MTETPKGIENSALAVAKDPRPAGYFPISLEEGLKETEQFIADLMGESEELPLEEAKKLYPELEQSPIPIYKDSYLLEHFLGTRLDYYSFNLEEAKKVNPSLLEHPSFNEYIFRLAGKFAMQSTLELNRTQEHFKDARKDKLTGVPNRRALFERIIEQEKAKIPFALLIVDIDKFKQKNDDYGHAAGDILLVQAAQRLTRSVRQARITMPGGTEQASSLEDTDLVVRFGGEEFVILVSGVTDPGELEQIGNRVVTSFNSQEFLLDTEHTIPVTASVGGALPILGEEPTKTLERADERLYKAKESGRNQYIGEPVAITV